MMKLLPLFAAALFTATLLQPICSEAVVHKENADAQEPARTFPRGTPESFVARRDFFVLMSMEERPEVMHALAADAVLARLMRARAESLHKAVASCSSATCFAMALRWTDGDLSSATKELRQLVETQSALRQFVKIVRKSGNYPLYEGKSDPDFLAAAWVDAVEAMNRIVDVYGTGLPPHYAKIDGPRFDTTSAGYSISLHALSMLIEDESVDNASFFFPTLKASVDLLAINDRLDAGRFEPLAALMNADAIAHARLIDWSKYRDSVILVPGEGPDIPNEELSPLGRLRVEQAVQLYRAGKAPFLLVSGGTVHPMLTEFCEAMEMRHELMTEWNVPAEAILVDPYARHTTTNIRNAVRQIAEYSLPMDKPFLVSSDYKQTAMILAPAFDRRCQDELHYLPYLSKQPLSPVLLEMTPDRRSLQLDAMDPMDP